MFTAIAAVSTEDELFVLGTSFGEVKCVRYMASVGGNSHFKHITFDENAADWEVAATAYSISCLHVHGSMVVLGDGNGTVVLLEVATGMEMRRYEMEAAVVSATWHGGTFVLGDLVGNVMGVDEYNVRWTKRMDIGIPSNIMTMDSVSTAAYVAALASVRLLDCADQICSYVAVSLGRPELLLTHYGHVVATVPAPSRITCVWSSSDQEAKASETLESTVFCGSDNGVVYKLTTLKTAEGVYSIQLHPIVEVGFRVTKIVSSAWRQEGKDVGSSNFAVVCGTTSTELVEFDVVKFRHEKHEPSMSSTPIDVACVRGHIFVLYDTSICVVDAVLAAASAVGFAA
ncbi:hypothetical protein H310_04925 [Aphanomyces invadans]|uniref:Cleavage/polyadenylation specificity factor A subunit N-terminal domain-containing protein n=1 Tax=Aphanomyces invadans TaxID=157072 RepID=A0A024UAP4_9STRA|nr:hypothetical protein H310_04925 [Aphanomyces invadans]ETW03471.1 hypothetical protein H310_04925 [Aphanomyces invadans]|eukprot:XP_008867700.1 hypothetical protein H310_04925 [Aphanomyces invadans]